MQTNISNVVTFIGNVSILLALLISTYGLITTLLAAKRDGSYKAHSNTIAKDLVWVLVVLGIAVSLYDFI